LKVKTQKFSNKEFSIGEDAYLVGPFAKKVSPNRGESLDEKLPLFIVLHYTATINADDAIEILLDEAREVSAHLVIDRDGGVSQLVPFDKIAWHAGVSSWDGISSLNRCSIGIELVNAGKLAKKDSKFMSWDCKEIAPSEVEEFLDNAGVASYWHAYPELQLTRLQEIVSLLKSKYAIKDVLMHSEIAPDRKMDPGPVFPIGKFSRRV